MTKTVYEQVKDNANRARRSRGRVTRKGHDGTAFNRFQSTAHDLKFDPCSYKSFNEARKLLFGENWKKASIIVERISR